MIVTMFEKKQTYLCDHSRANSPYCVECIHGRPHDGTRCGHGEMMDNPAEHKSTATDRAHPLHTPAVIATFLGGRFDVCAPVLGRFLPGT